MMSETLRTVDGDAYQLVDSVPSEELLFPSWQLWHTVVACLLVLLVAIVLICGEPWRKRS